MKKIVAFPNGSGATYWRIVDPFKYMKGFDCKVETRGISPEVVDDADIFVLQSIVDKDALAYLYYLQQEKGKKIVCDCDDLIELDANNPHFIEHKMTDAHFTIQQTMKIADMITTTTPYLADKLREYNEKVVVLPNYMDMKRWDGEIQINDTDEIRVGWMGSITHYDDIKLIEKPVKDVLREHPEVKLILMGDVRFTDLFKGYNVEVRLGVPFDVYPQILRALRIDIGLAPLVDNEFNRCKSPIKTYEYALINALSIVSDVEPYKNSLAHAKCKTEKEWYYALEELISKPHGYRSMVAKVKRRNLMDKLSLEKHADEWIEAYKGLE